MNTDRKLYPSIGAVALITAFLLLIPLVAMQYTNEVKWTLFDFVIAGTFLFGTGLTYLLITRKLATKMAENSIYRLAVGFALFTGLFLLWVNGAVGIIGSEDNPANLMYFGVLAVGVIGVFAARFQSKGMARTMYVMAIAQMLVAVIALVVQQATVSPVAEVLGINGFFAALWIGSGLLFRLVAREQET